MKSAKVVINILIVLFLGLGIYFKITDTIAKGTYFSRYGDAHKSSIYWYSLFFFACDSAHLRRRSAETSETTPCVRFRGASQPGRAVAAGASLVGAVALTPGVPAGE